MNDMGAGKTVEDWDAWTDRMKAEHGNGNGHGASLAIEAQRLLPTPMAAEGTKPSNTMGAVRRRATGEVFLTNEIVTLAGLDPSEGREPGFAGFGQYAAAVNRWADVIGRPAPAPTEPTGKNDAHRLSPAFVEWMMGLPAGHVTDVPNLTRNEQLKALGNGVVVQQAEAALRILLGTMSEVAA